MEKLIIFLPIMLFFGFFFLLVIGFFFLIFKLVMKSKNTAWSGVVVDKKHNVISTDDDGFHKKEDRYFLVVDADIRKGMKVGLSPQMWDQFVIGDAIKKPKGKLYPEKA